MNKILIISIILLISSSCLHKKCDNAFENARGQNRDTALFYIWRLTDNLIHPDGINTDSDYICFMPNGDYCRTYQRKYIRPFTDVWYTESDLIVRIYCLDNVPEQSTLKYYVKSDTLYLGGGMDDGTFDTIPPDTYVKVSKY